MNEGLYLVKNQTGEFMSINGVDRQSGVKIATAESLLEKSLIRQCLKVGWRKNLKYVLTDAGRVYRRIEN